MSSKAARVVSPASGPINRGSVSGSSLPSRKRPPQISSSICSARPRATVCASESSDVATEAVTPNSSAEPAIAVIVSATMASTSVNEERRKAGQGAGKAGVSSGRQWMTAIVHGNYRPRTGTVKTGEPQA